MIAMLFVFREHVNRPPTCYLEFTFFLEGGGKENVHPTENNPTELCGEGNILDLQTHGLATHNTKRVRFHTGLG